jgi:hypothetical protein
MSLKIAKQVFNVSTACVLGNVSRGKLSWSIDIRASPMRVRAEIWTPRAYSERLLPIDGINLINWSDAFRQKITWEGCYDDRQGVVNASLYVSEHNDIYQSTLDIRPLSGADFKIKWRAKCDVFFDGHKDNLDLDIETEGVFGGIIVGQLGETIWADKAEKRLREHIAEGEFEFRPAETEHDFPLMCLSNTQ